MEILRFQLSSPSFPIRSEVSGCVFASSGCHFARRQHFCSFTSHEPKLIRKEGEKVSKPKRHTCRCHYLIIFSQEDDRWNWASRFWRATQCIWAFLRLQIWMKGSLSSVRSQCTSSRAPSPPNMLHDHSDTAQRICQFGQIAFLPELQSNLLQHGIATPKPGLVANKIWLTVNQVEKKRKMTSNLCCFVSLNMILQTSCCFCTLESMYSMYANSALSSSFTLAL